MATKENYISIAGQHPTVTLVSNGAMAGRQSGTGSVARHSQVLVTPLRQSLTSTNAVQQQRSSTDSIATRPAVNLQSSMSKIQQQFTVRKIDKVLLKAVNKKGKKDPKTFTLRNIDQHAISTGDDLKSMIRKKLSDDITTGEFDVGYIQGTTVVRVRSSEDLEELWSLLRQPQKNTVLWCDGLVAHAGRKRKHSDDDDDDDSDGEPPSKKSKSKKCDVSVQQVQDTVDQLKTKYGANYTQMQYRIWAELVVGGMCSMDGPPSNNSMFKRAGTGDAASKRKSESRVSQALTDAATAITAPLSKKDTQEAQQSTPQPSTSSPAKLIENRSKLYKQLSELKNLKGCGVLDDAEYAAEKATIMDLLKQLSSK